TDRGEQESPRAERGHEFETAVADVDSVLHVHDEERAEHEQEQQDAEHGDEHTEDERETTEDLDPGGDERRDRRGGHAHSFEARLGAFVSPRVELLQSVREEDDAEYEPGDEDADVADERGLHVEPFGSEAGEPHLVEATTKIATRGCSFNQPSRPAPAGYRRTPPPATAAHPPP